MLSQLASGQRVKISNPAVLARLLRLEELLSSTAVRTGDRAALDQALSEVAASRPSLTTEQATDPLATVADHLSRLASPADLARAAAAVPGTPLAALLAEAATRQPR